MDVLHIGIKDGNVDQEFLDIAIILAELLQQIVGRIHTKCTNGLLGVVLEEQLDEGAARDQGRAFARRGPP